MLLGLDCDGVLVKIREHMSLILKLTRGISVPYYFCTRTYLLSNQILTAEQYEDLCQLVYHSKDYAKLLSIQDGAAYWLLKLNELGYQFKVATHRSDDGIALVLPLLSRYGLEFLPFQSIPPKQSKAPALFGCYAYLDDDIQVLDLLQEMPAKPKLYLFRRAYNIEADINNLDGVIHSWQEYFALVRSWSK